MVTQQDITRVKNRFSIIGNAPSLVSAIERALQVAPIDLAVLIIGESGAGKEFFPKIIHENSSRKHRNYIAVNCGAIPEGTIDSELFGHEKGAFTGAISSRKGYFEEANGGTIFLDEVAELPLTTQARLLRVLESGEFIRVGSSEVQKTNIRVVAATNKDMVREVQEGRFREDLYYRLSTVQIAIPPLRDRGQDILLLTRKFVNDFAETYRTPPVTLDESAQRLILQYRWPGNVRQLKNVVEQMALFEAGNVIDGDTVSRYLPDLGNMYLPTVVGKGPQFDYTKEREMLFTTIMKMQQEIEHIKDMMHGREDEHREGTHVATSIAEIKREPRQLSQYEPLDYADEGHDAAGLRSATNHDSRAHAHGHVHDIQATAVEPVDDRIVTLEQMERETIMRALHRNGGRRKPTAEQLAISERTLYRKIKEYGLEDNP